ncbi:MAG: hypothetical protein VX278_11715 [Myxococcota bacterium]|nr:hypothetical protein [Myxococcota bacterium]
MRYVLAWCSVCFVVGVWAWPFWEPSLKQLQWAILGMLVLLFSLRSRTSVTSFFPLYVSAFCLGGTCCARYPDPLNEYTGALIGDVRFRVGKRALVSSSKGRFWLVFYGDAPKEGERFAAWVSPKQEPISLPGDPNPTWRRKRARAGYLKVKDWVPFRPRDRESRFED